MKTRNEKTVYILPAAFAAVVALVCVTGILDPKEEIRAMEPVQHEQEDPQTYRIPDSVREEVGRIELETESKTVIIDVLDRDPAEKPQNEQLKCEESPAAAPEESTAAIVEEPAEAAEEPVPEWYGILLRAVSAENGGSYRRAYLTASCILNRADAWYGGDVEAAIYDPGQFEVVENGRIWEAPVTEAAQAAVDDALADPDGNVWYFSCGDLHSGYADIYDIVEGEYFYSMR